MRSKSCPPASRLGHTGCMNLSSACTSLNCCVFHTCSDHTGSVSAAALLPLAALSFSFSLSISAENRTHHVEKIGETVNLYMT